MIEIFRAESAEEFSVVAQLFQEYADTLGFDLAFQDFDRELADPGSWYGSPGGAVFLARRGQEICGCAAVRGFGPKIAEMKRLYVRPGCRGLGLGRMLAEETVLFARQAGYLVMRLDTIDFMKEALALYESMGFRTTDPYRYNPVAGATYLELEL